MFNHSHRVRRQVVRVRVRSAPEAFAARTLLRQALEGPLLEALGRALDAVACPEDLHLGRLDLRVRSRSVDELPEAIAACLERDMSPALLSAMARASAAIHPPQAGQGTAPTAPSASGRGQSPMGDLGRGEFEDLRGGGPVAAAAWAGPSHASAGSAPPLVRRQAGLDDRFVERATGPDAEELRGPLHPLGDHGATVPATGRLAEASAPLPSGQRESVAGAEAALDAFNGSASRPSAGAEPEAPRAASSRPQGEPGWAGAAAGVRAAGNPPGGWSGLPHRPGSLVHPAAAAHGASASTHQVEVDPRPVERSDDASAPEVIFTQPCRCPLAGLVLLHPFLPRFLEACGVPIGAGGIPPDAVPRAAALLRLVATGDPGAVEPDAASIALLLGLPLDARLPAAPQDVSALDREEVDALLAAAVSHWRVLKQTSTAGLQVTFLQREGILSERADGYLLRMAPAPWDVLLGLLPWALGVVRLPWMQRTVFVEWPAR